MESCFSHLYHLYTLVNVFFLISFYSCFSPKNLSVSNDIFATTVATWYGPPDGAGSNGRACGYQGTVEFKPFNKLISAGGSALYHDGLECETCYQIKCNSNPTCSGNPVVVTIIDLCPGSCGPNQFDFSGTAFGAMAASGSNPYYFATNIEFEAGDGDLGKVELQNGSGPFKAMAHSYGATWKFNSGVTITGPISIKLTAHSEKSVTTQNMIHVG